jgi:hypothetical protein
MPGRPALIIGSMANVIPAAASPRRGVRNEAPAVLVKLPSDPMARISFTTE